MNLFFPMLLLGLVTGVHCVTMCGPLVLTYAIRGDGRGTVRTRMLPHAAYQSAKIASYVVVGLALGAIGAAFNLAGVRGWVTVFAGVFMILMGLNLTGWFPWLRWVSLRPPRFMKTALTKLRRKADDQGETGEPTLATPILFGALTGLMPCGPLQSAQIAAAGTGSALYGGLAMLGFGLGTIPLMLGFGAIAGVLSSRFKERLFAVAAVAIVILGIVMLNRGAMIVGSPVTFDTVSRSVLGGGSAGTDKPVTAADGVTVVRIAIVDTRYVPEVVRIPAERPVRLIVDRREDVACSDQLAVPQLGVLANLRPNGTTAVDLPPAKAGSYTLTCGMGMMSGRIEAVAAPSGR